jgi:chaperonin cofactor prefoldin
LNLIEAIDRLITERGSSAVLDKHLSFIRDQAQALEKQVDALKKENSGLITELGECQSNLATKSSQNYIGPLPGPVMLT